MIINHHASKFIISLMILFSSIACSKRVDPDFIKYQGIKSAEIILAKEHFSKVQKENQLFRVLVDEIKNSADNILIEFSKEVEIAGFVPEYNGEIRLQFNGLENFKDENILIEELFHAFQAQYYGIEKMKPNEQNLIIGAANFEYEARLMKAIMAAYLDKSISETPSQKGLLDFAMSLLDKKGKIRSLKLDSVQHQKYISLVAHFQQHWQNRNIKEGVGNVYDNPIDSSLGPEACFYILRKYHSAIDKDLVR